MRDDNCSRDHSQHAKHHVHETQSSIPCTSIARKRKKLQCPLWWLPAQSIAIAYKERYDRPSNGYQDEERAADCQKSGLHLEAKAPGPKGSGTRGPDRHIRSPCSFTRRTAPSLDVSASAVPRSRRSLYHLAKLLSGCAPTMRHRIGKSRERAFLLLKLARAAVETDVCPTSACWTSMSLGPLKQCHAAVRSTDLSASSPLLDPAQCGRAASVFHPTLHLDRVVPRCSLDFDRFISLANSPNAHRKDKATAATNSADNQDARRLLGGRYENATGHSPNNGDYDTNYRHSDKECSKALNGVPQLGHLDNATDRTVASCHAPYPILARPKPPANRPGPNTNAPCARIVMLNSRLAAAPSSAAASAARNAASARPPVKTVAPATTTTPATMSPMAVPCWST